MQREEQILRKVKRQDTRSREYDYPIERSIEEEYNDVIKRVPARATASKVGLTRSSEMGNRTATRSTVTRRTTVSVPRTDDDEEYYPLQVVNHKKHHPILFAGIGAIAMVLLVTGVQFGYSAISDGINSMKYGDIRTTSIDANVGHGGISHFIAQNYNQRMIIIEFQGGDPTKNQLLQGIVLESSKTPIELLFKDVNGDGKLDLIAKTVETQPKAWIVLNDGKKFDPTIHVTSEDVLNAEKVENK